MTFRLHHLLSVHRRIPHEDNEPEITFEAVSKTNADARNTIKTLIAKDQPEGREDASDIKIQRDGPSDEDDERTLKSPPVIRRKSHHELGFRPLLVEQFADESDLLCDIHFGVLKDPARCSHCGARFCMSCVETWQSRETGNCNHCPLCLLVLTPESIYRDEKLSERLLEEQAKQADREDGSTSIEERKDGTPEKSDEELVEGLEEYQEVMQAKEANGKREEFDLNFSPKSVISLESKRFKRRQTYSAGGRLGRVKDRLTRVDEGQETESDESLANVKVMSDGRLKGSEETLNGSADHLASVGKGLDGSRGGLALYEDRLAGVEERLATSEGRLAGMEERLAKVEDYKPEDSTDLKEEKSEMETLLKGSDSERLARVEKLQASADDRQRFEQGRLQVVEERLKKIEDRNVEERDLDPMEVRETENHRLKELERLQASTDDRLIVAGARLTGIADGLAGAEQRQTGLEDRLNGVEKRVNDMASTLQEILEEQKRDRQAFWSREKSILESKKKDREAFVYLLSFGVMLLAYPYSYITASK